MPILRRGKTTYPGVSYIDGTSVMGKPERIFYIRYRKNGKSIEEKAGRQIQDNMTPAKANSIRAERINGKQLSNKERRKMDKAEKLNKAGGWTLNKLWESYKDNNLIKGIGKDKSRFQLYIKSTLGDKQPHELSPFDGTASA